MQMKRDVLWAKRVNKLENKLKNNIDNLFYKKIVVIHLLILLIVMLSCHPYTLSCLYITYVDYYVYFLYVCMFATTKW